MAGTAVGRPNDTALAAYQVAADNCDALVYRFPNRFACLTLENIDYICHG